MQPTKSFRTLLRPALMLLAGAFAAAMILFLVTSTASAQSGPSAGGQPLQAKSIHPAFPLLDSAGQNVLISNQSISTMKTCGACHDTQFITSHSFHTDAGLSTFGAEIGGAHAWDQSSGMFGKWDPLTYRFLSPQGDKQIDLTTAEWIELFGDRHVGGGPAELSRSSQPLTALAPDAGNVETSIIDPASGQPAAWDWRQSGTEEMDCFLCHTPDPNNAARVEALRAGKFGEANTATLLGKGIVGRGDSGWDWDVKAFDGEGNLLVDKLPIQEPTNQNCGLCHGTVHTNAQDPLIASADCLSNGWSTDTTGQIISPQKLSNSGMNLQGKGTLSRTWDVHAERVVECTACHYSLNNPIYFQQPDQARPQYLTFDPRRIDLSDYLKQPLHQFAKGDVSGGVQVAGVDDTLRGCKSCHDVQATHNWLPYKDRHMSALACETCHIPKMYAPAVDYVDWTVLKADGKPVTACRGVSSSDPNLITGFTPVLLPRQNADGSTSLAPNNVVTSWYWVYGDPARPVPERDLQTAWLENGQYPAEVLSAFDANKDGQLSKAELTIDTDAKKATIAKRLQKLGLANPRIESSIQAYSINHDIAAGEYATRECSTCHTQSSRLAMTYPLSDRTPGDVLPTFKDGAVKGLEINQTDELACKLNLSQTAFSGTPLYIFGHCSVAWIDWLGIGLFLATMLGVVVHGGLRTLAARRMATLSPEANKVYMYSFYERLWHWLQTAAILILIVTGLIIHKPDMFGIFAFEYVVQVHNIFAALLVINAALSLFYHLVSGEIRQYLPRPYGFFDDTIVQAKYYLSGIFKGEKHPFEKTPQHKLNPLQQATYFGILNVLLPLQILTGELMWGAQQWPDIANRFGGLPWLAPAHTLIAWLFAAFIVLHIYLTTTGHTPLASIKAMIMGWDEVELHNQASKGSVTS